MALDNELAVDIIHSVGCYWSDNELSDCRISVDGQVFQASRFHLSACSEFFRQVFHTESITHKENIVIKGISADVFSCVIKALFTGVTGLDESNMVDVWLAASYLKIDFLVKKSEQFIEEHLTAQNYIQLYERISCMSSADIINKLVILMVQDFEEFRKTETFLNLPSETVIKIVESGEIKSQDSLVESVLKWGSHVPKDVVGTFGLQLYHDFQDLMEKNCEDSCVTFGFSKEHLYQFVADDVTRSQILGQLIKKMKLGELSETGLKMIYEDKLAIEHHDVKDVVMHEMAARMLYKSDNKVVAVYQNAQPVNLSSDMQVTKISLDSQNDLIPKEVGLHELESYDIFEIPDWVVASYNRIQKTANSDPKLVKVRNCCPQEVVVFFIDNTFVVYSLRLQKSYTLKEIEYNIKHFYVFEDNLFFSFANKLDGTSAMQIVCPDNLALAFEGKNDYATSNRLKYYMAYPYIYKFHLHNTDLIISRTNMREYREDQWTIFLNLSLSKSKDCQVIFYHSIIKGNKIVFFVTGDVTKIIYFDVKFRELHELYSVDGEMANFKIFQKREGYYLLLGNGQLFEIVITDTVTIVFRQQLWMGTLNLFGAVPTYSDLFVFTDTRANVKMCKVDFTLKMVVVDSFVWNRQCEILRVPNHWLRNDAEIRL